MSDRAFRSENLRSDHCRVKICGITRVEDAVLAAELGAWALGYIFWKESPRFVQPRQVSRILAELTMTDGKSGSKYGSVLAVGVFVNPTPEELFQAVEESGVQAVQLHGDETPERYLELQQAIGRTHPKLHWIVAHHSDSISAERALTDRSLAAHTSDPGYSEASDPRAFGRLERFMDLDTPPACHLIDAFVPGVRGGSGKVANWDFAIAAQSRLQNRASVILSGGIRSSNLEQAILAVHPFALDLSSGVEASPGIKSPELLRGLFEKVKGLKS